MTDTLFNLAHQTAFFNLTIGNVIMVAVALVLMYLAIAKQYEPLLLLPISFGMLLVNIYPPIIQEGGLLWYFYKLDEWAILPSLIFLGVGALTDFGPLIANPKSFLLGAAAQFGVFGAFFLAMLIGFNAEQAAAVSIIGGADGPTSIFLAMKLGQKELMGPIAVAAYSYMSLVPIIQPPIMRALTTEKERRIKMEQLRPVSKRKDTVPCDRYDRRLLPASVDRTTYWYADAWQSLQRKRRSKAAARNGFECTYVYRRHTAGNICRSNDQRRSIPECFDHQNRCYWSHCVLVRYRRRRAIRQADVPSDRR